MFKAPIPYSPGVETVEPDEAETFQELTKVFTDMVEKTHADLGKAQRGVHTKAHALLEGELLVHDTLIDEQRQGIFKEPGRRYPVIIRLSSTPTEPLPDAVSLPRGFSVKVLGVEGARLPGAENIGADTQDLILASVPAFGAPTPKKFLGNLKLLAATTDRAEWAKVLLSKILRPIEKGLEAVGLEAGALKGFGGYPEKHPLGERYYSQAPLRFGDYIAKFDVVPESENFRALAEKEIDVDTGPDRNPIREELQRVLATEGGAWTLRVQLCRDLQANPIEDAAKVWPEEDNPYISLATISVGPQTSWSPEREQKLNDETVFKPWQGIEDHRPLGGVMRARQAAYLPVQVLRAKLNGCPFHEPRSLPVVD